MKSVDVFIEAPGSCGALNNFQCSDHEFSFLKRFAESFNAENTGHADPFMGVREVETQGENKCQQG